MSQPDPEGDPRPRRPISPARLAANRANSLLSTGPRTPRGKAVSKLNGLVHSFCAEEALLPGECGEELQRRRDTWAFELGATTEAERRCTDNAVDACWRIDRCRRADHAAVERNMIAAAGRGDAQNEDDVDMLAQHLEINPA